MSSAPAGYEGAGSPLFTVLFGVTGPQISRLPDVDASKIPKATIVPQFAVGAGKVIAPPFCVAPPVPDDATAVVVPCVDSHAESLGPTCTRA
jgi:hypothetical protein